MIFGRKSVERDGGQVPLEFVLVGLSQENVHQLQAGKPVSIGPVAEDPSMFNMQLIITYGETEEDMVASLKKIGLIDPNTKISEGT